MIKQKKAKEINQSRVNHTFRKEKLCDELALIRKVKKKQITGRIPADNPKGLEIDRANAEGIFSVLAFLCSKFSIAVLQTRLMSLSIARFIFVANAPSQKSAIFFYYFRSFHHQHCVAELSH